MAAMRAPSTPSSRPAATQVKSDAPVTVRSFKIPNSVLTRILDYPLVLADSSSDEEEVTSRPLATIRPLRTLTPRQRAAADRSALARQQLLVHRLVPQYPSCLPLTMQRSLRPDIHAQRVKVHLLRVLVTLQTLPVAL